MDDLLFVQEKAKDPKQSLGQAELMNQIGRMAKSLGFNEAGGDQTGFDEERGRLTSAVMHAVREEEIQKGRPLNFDERQKIIQRTAIANHEALTKKQRDGHPEDREALKRKADVGGIVVPNTAEIYRNGVNAATTVGSTVRGFLAELWNSGAVDTGQMAFEGAVRASPFGTLIAIAEAVTGENLLEPFTSYTDGAKVEMTPEMRLGGSLAEFLPMGILSKTKKGRSIAKAIKNESVANLPKHTAGKNSITGGTLTDKQHKTAQTAKTESDTLIAKDKHSSGDKTKQAELNANNQGETSQQQLTKPQFFSTELLKDINTTVNAINQGSDHFFSSIIKSSKGNLHVAAEIKTNGTQLQFSALTVYPYEGKIQKNSILKDILSIKKRVNKSSKRKRVH